MCTYSLPLTTLLRVAYVLLITAEPRAEADAVRGVEGPVEQPEVGVTSGEPDQRA